MLSDRVRRPELMDQPGLAVEVHAHALAGLRRLNVASRAAHKIWREISRLTGIEPGGRLHILDVASGGGDVALGLWHRARRRRIALKILGLDASATACRVAADHCRIANGDITFEHHDVVAAALPRGFDVAICTLFLHHLADVEAHSLLRNLQAAASRIVISDLRRGVPGYALAQAACRLLSRSPVVRADGPQSVANAFSLAEMRRLCDAAGLADATVRRTWPARLMVTYRGGPCGGGGR